VKETLEEAGVSGNLMDDTVGKYSYKKWGGLCKVDVYALNVNEVFDEWDEKDFRQRVWFKADDALKSVKPEQLQKIIKLFLKQQKIRQK